jgi:hypothetical protein
MKTPNHWDYILGGLFMAAAGALLALVYVYKTGGF